MTVDSNVESSDLRHIKTVTDQGWGLLSQFPPFLYFLNFSALSEHMLAIEYHVYIWQVSPQLSCGGTCQIYTWFKEFERYFCQIENFACREINERSFSNPHGMEPKCWEHHSKSGNRTVICLTHWGRDKGDKTLQTTFSNAFSLMKIVVFWQTFDLNLIPRVQLATFQHWFW